MGMRLRTNFTPIIDNVAADVGHVGALVFGVVFRYGQQRGGTCSASLDAIGDRAHISSRTVKRHLKVLCEKAYLVDYDPGLRNAPHRYGLTPKGQLSLGIGGDAGMTESTTSPPIGMTESPSGYDRESDLNASKRPDRYDRESIEETPDSEKSQKTPENPDRDSISDSESGSESDSESDIERGANAPRHPTPNTRKRSPKQKAQDDMKRAIADLCFCAGLSKRFILLSKRDQGKVRTLATAWLAASYTAEDVVSFGEWWFANDWRGKKGQRPTPDQAKSEWPKFLAFRSGEAPPKPTNDTDRQREFLRQRYQEAVKNGK